MQEFSQEEAAGVVVGRESCDRTGVRNYGIDEDIGNVRCIKPVAQFLGFLDEGRADDNGVGFLVGDAVECGFAGIYVVLVVVGVVAGDIDVRILFDGVLDTRLDGTPVLSGTGDGGGDSDPESLSAGDGRDVEVELVVYFGQYPLHGFPARPGDVAPVVQDSVDGPGGDAGHLCNIFDFYLLPYHLYLSFRIHPLQIYHKLFCFSKKMVTFARCVRTQLAEKL